MKIHKKCCVFLLIQFWNRLANIPKFSMLQQATPPSFSMYERMIVPYNERANPFFERCHHAADSMIANALSIAGRKRLSRVPIYSRKRRLSIVRICSSRMIESLSSPSTSFTSVCVGNFAFVCVLPVMAAIMTVGLWLFPISLEMISTGRMPPCSEPTTGLSSRKYLRSGEHKKC